MAWTAWTAWRRRSTALALVVIGFAGQWLPWSRIDRATFQYHYYTTLPFLVLAVGYFLAELWHGPSARTWLLARASAAVAIVAPALLWLLRAPLCAVSGVQQMKPGSQACGYVSEAFVLTERVAVSLLVLVVGVLVFAWQVRTLGIGTGEDGAGSADRAARRFPAGSGWVGLTVVSTTAALALAQTRFTELPLISAPIGDLAPMVAAAAILPPLAFAAWLALGARDPRRFTVGVVGAMGLWFVLFYPDIGALPVPTGLARLFQTLPLPTYNYDFQFAVHRPGAALPDAAAADLQLRFPVLGQHGGRRQDIRARRRIAGPDRDGRLPGRGRHVRHVVLAACLGGRPGGACAGRGGTGRLSPKRRLRAPAGCHPGEAGPVPSGSSRWDGRAMESGASRGETQLDRSGSPALGR